MAHAQKPDFVFQRNGRVHLNRRGRQFSQLLAAKVRASAVVMLDTACFEEVRKILTAHSVCHFPLHFPSRVSPCATTFQLDFTLYSGHWLFYVVFQNTLLCVSTRIEQNSINLTDIGLGTL